MSRLILAQLRILLGIALASLRRRSLRAATTVIGAVGVVAMLVALLSIAEGYDRVVRTTTSKASVLVLMDGASAEIASSIPGDEVALLRQSDLLARDGDGAPLLSAELFTTAKLPARQPGTEMNISLRGVEPAAYVLSGTRVVSGRKPASGRREVLVGRQASARLAGVAIGNEVRIGPSRWRVVGEFASDNGLAESELWVDAGALAANMNRGDVVQSLHVQLAEGVPLADFVRAIDDDPRLHLRALDLKQYLDEQSGALRGFVHVLSYGISFLMGLGAAFAALGASYASVSARIREIGTLKAMGFQNLAIFAAVIVESLLLTCLGGALGALGAYFVFDGLQTSTVLFSNNYTQVAFAFVVSPWILVQAALLAIAIGLLGSLYPAWQVLRISISLASAERR